MELRMKTFKPEEKYLLEPVKELLQDINDKKTPYISIYKRIKKIDDTFDYYDILLTEDNKHKEDTKVLEELFETVNSCFDLSTVQPGDYNSYSDLPDMKIHNRADYEAFTKRYYKLITDAFCSRNFMFTTFGKCKLCHSEINLSYHQLRVFKNRNSGKENPTPTYCNRCRTTMKYKKELKSKETSKTRKKDIERWLRYISKEDTDEEFFPIKYLDTFPVYKKSKEVNYYDKV